MKLSVKQKKWLKRIGILVAIRIVFGLVIYYAVVYRFRDIVQLALNIETKSAYQFEAGDIDVQLFKGKIDLKNASLHFRDSTNHVTHHDVKIPELELEIESFKDLIFHSRLNIRNLTIVRPDLATTAFAKNQNKNVSLHISNIITGLKKLTRHLNIEQLTLDDGSFSYKTIDSKTPLSGDNISISIKGFSDQNLEKQKFMGAQEITISVKNQTWNLPDGRHEISFKSLLLSVEKEILDIDSFSVRIKNGDTTNLRFFTDRIIMKSGSLMPSLEENGAEIDSVLVIHPVLDIDGTGPNKSKQIRKTDSIRYFLDHINIKYLDIIEGQVEYGTNSGSLASTDKANLKVYNFKLNSLAEHKVTTDSISLSLRDIQFYSKDSLFKLTVGHFGFEGDHLNFDSVSFGPSELNKTFRGLVFNAPSVQLKNIEPGDLIRKKVTASQAFLIRPSIKYYRGQAMARDSSTALRTDHHTLMVQNLHNIIDVPEFHLIDGMLSIHNERRPQEKISAEHMNAFIKLNEFTGGESKQQMKAAIKSWTAEKFQIGMPAMNLIVNGLHFNGEAQHSLFKSLQLELKNGTTLTAENLQLDQLDADMLLNQKKIDLRKVKFGNAKVKLVNSGNNNDDHRAKKSIPFYIGQISIDKLQFESQNQEGKTLSFNGNALYVQALTNESGHLAWNKINGDLTDILQRKKNSEMTVEAVSVDHNLLKLKNLNLKNTDNNSGNRFEIPSLVISTPIFKSGKPTVIDNFEADNPRFFFVKNDTAKHQNVRINLPEDITLKKVKVNNAEIRFTDHTGEDSLHYEMKASMEVNGFNITEGRTPEIHFTHFKISGKDAELRKGPVRATIPGVNFAMDGGSVNVLDKNQFLLSANTNITWNNVQFAFDKESNHITAADISGSFRDPKFSFHTGEKFVITNLARHFHLSAANLVYAYPEGTVTSRTFSWNQKENRSIELDSFSLTPRAGWDEWIQEARWQADYMTLKGKSLVVSDIDFIRKPGETVLDVGNITADGILLTLKKDKRKPFRHGIDKGMPTELISKINFPIKVDSIQIKNSEIMVTQISEKTGKPGNIPVSNMNILITGVSNKKDFQHLNIVASAQILDNYIRDLSYSEGYASNADFAVSAKVSKMVLPTFNPISVPMANVAVKNGLADTLFASWKGNKYAAIGKMDFYYNGLKVNFISKKDPGKKTVLTWFENGIANMLIRSNNNGNSYMILTERNNEKFFIVYWVKSLMSGMMTTAGIKKDRKYRKTYNKMKAEWKIDYPEYLQ